MYTSSERKLTRLIRVCIFYYEAHLTRPYYQYTQGIYQLPAAYVITCSIIITLLVLLQLFFLLQLPTLVVACSCHCTMTIVIISVSYRNYVLLSSSLSHTLVIIASVIVASISLSRLTSRFLSYRHHYYFFITTLILISSRQYYYQ